MSKNILSKFSKVYQTPENTFQKEDMEFFRKKFQDLENYKIFRKEFIYFLERNSHLESEILKFSNFKYIFNDGVSRLAIYNLAESQLYILKSIYDYIHSKYAIDLNHIYMEFERKIKCDKFEYSLEYILDPVISLLGGMDLNSKMEEEIKNTFRSRFGIIEGKRESQFPILNKELISFPNAFSYEYNFQGAYRICYYSEEYFKKFVSTLNYFDKGEYNFQAELNCTLTSIEFGNFINLDSFDKISAIRFFKNGKVVLKFKSVEFSTQFFNNFCI